VVAVLRPLLRASPLARGASFERMIAGPGGELERQRIRVQAGAVRPSEMKRSAK